MAISNISGTTMPSFKLKQNGGIELISAAIRNEEGKVISNRFRVRTKEYDAATQTTVDVDHDVAYYDTHIASKDIRCLKHVTNPDGTRGLKIYLRDGGSFTIDNLIRKDAVTFDTEDENYEADRVVVIGSTDNGKTVLKAAPYKVVGSYDNTSALSDIPTIQATKSIAEEVIETASIDLKERVYNGSNVTIVD